MSSWHSIQPLIAFSDPYQVWSEQPTLLIAECLFLVMFLSITVHAFSCKTGSAYRALWMASLTGGAAIELMTILNKEIGNFYHSQAVLMLFGRREPVYMLFGCYGWFNYVSVALAWHAWEGNLLATSFMSALLGSFLWGLLDMVGLKLLWWTWHNNEPLYEKRHQGVPIASTFWIMASCFALGFLMEMVRRQMTKNPSGFCNRFSIIIGGIIGPFATTIVMNLPFLVLYHPLVTAAGLSPWYALFLFRVFAVCGLVYYTFGRGNNNVDKTSRVNLFLVFQVFILIISCLLMFLLYDPNDSIRTSYGQPFTLDNEKCNLMEESFWGAFKRKRFVCPDGIEESRDMYRICPSISPYNEGTWRYNPKMYTLCGTTINNEFWKDLIFQCGCTFMITVYALIAREIATQSTNAASQRKKK